MKRVKDAFDERTAALDGLLGLSLIHISEPTRL